MKKFILLILTVMLFSQTAYAYNFPEPDWGALLNERKRMETETDFELYAEGDTSLAPYYGARLEPRSGVYIGTIPEYSQGFESLSSYLTYINYNYESDLYFSAKEVLQKGKSVLMVGLNVTDMNVDYDVIRNILNKLSGYDAPIFIRFANEMNCSNLGDDPDKYVSVFRNVADMIHEYPNFASVWSPNDMGALDRPFEYYYPGDEYVDWIGASCYMTKYFTNEKNTSAVNEQYFMTGDYAWATNKIKPLMKFLSDNNIKKPVMISEGGIARLNGFGDDYSGWHEPRLRNMLYNLIMKYPQIKMVNYFNRPADGFGEHYYISDYPSSMSIFNEASQCGAYLKTYGAEPDFVFTGAAGAGTLVAENGMVKLYTLAHIPGQSDISVNYRIDGEWYHSSQNIPYVCNLDINSLSDGEHTLTINAADQRKSYTFYKRNGCIKFGGEPDTSLVREKEISVTINDKEVSFDQAPIIVNDRTLVPIRAIFEAMGYSVDWNQSAQTAYAQKGNDTVTVKLGNSEISCVINGKSIKYTCDVPPQIISDRILVPVRAIAESTGCTVSWDNSARRVIIKQN